MADLGASFDGGAVQTIPDYNSAFMQLDSGAVDAVACDLSIAAFQMSQAEGKYVQLDEKLLSEHYGVGFKKGDAETADAVNGAMLELYKDGTVKTLCDKYADQGIESGNWVLTE